MYTATFAHLIKKWKIRALHHIKGDGPNKGNCNQIFLPVLIPIRMKICTPTHLMTADV